MSVLKYCKVCKKCNGCQLSNLSYNDQVKYKQKQLRLTFGNMIKPERLIPSEKELNYRNKAQVVFKKDKSGVIRFGIYQSGDKGITLTDYCPLHTDRANKVSATLCKLFKKYSLLPFDFRRKKGFVRSALIREGFDSGEMLVALICSSNTFKNEKDFADELVKIHPYIKTVVLTQSTSEKLTTGGNPRVIYGDGFIKDTLCRLNFNISYNTFYQINPLQTEKLYSTAIKLAKLQDTDTVLDAYCGIGTISLAAAKECKKVVGIELNENSIENAVINAKENSVVNAEFYANDVKKQIIALLNKGYKFDACFVDPPRMGCDIEFLKSLVKAEIPKIIYISCNIDTQRRDANFLLKHGYKIKTCRGVDMFPFTKHVECIVLFEKLSLSDGKEQTLLHQNSISQSHRKKDTK